MRAGALLLATVLALPSVRARADTPAAVDPAAADAGAVHPSVYRLDPAWDIPVAAGSATVISLAYLFSSRLITPHCPPCSPSSVNRLDRLTVDWDSHAANVAADGFAVAFGAGVFLFDLEDVRHAGGRFADTATDIAVIGEAVLVTAALTTVAKYVSQRPLPSVLTGRDTTLAGEPGGYRAFWSGHAAFGAAAAAGLYETYHLRHPSSRAATWILAGGLACAAGLGVLKIAGGTHYITDVAAGMIVGTGVGLGVPYLHRRGDRVEVAPLPGGAAASLALRF